MRYCACCNKDCDTDEIVNGYCKECWSKGTVTIPAPVYEKLISRFSDIEIFSRYAGSVEGDIPRKMCEIILGIPKERGIGDNGIH